jgi:hypothetical protein
VAAPPDPDERFLQLLTDSGASIFDSRLAIGVGRAQCDSMASNPGRSIGGAAVVLQQQYPGLTLDQAMAFVRAALEAYCPQYLPGTVGAAAVLEEGG